LFVLAQCRIIPQHPGLIAQDNCMRLQRAPFANIS
jgi:hypothetical protein